MNEEELKKQIKQEIKQELKKEQKKKRRIILSIILVVIAVTLGIIIKQDIEREPARKNYEQELERIQAEQEEKQKKIDALTNLISYAKEEINEAISELEQIAAAKEENASITNFKGQADLRYLHINERREEITNNEYLNNIEESKINELNTLYNKYIKLYNEYKGK